MNIQSEIVVIGGGLSGATAALRAASLGREVVLVRKGYGGTAVGSGAVEILGTRGAERQHRPFDVRKDARYDPVHELASLMHRRAAHPYRLFVGEESASEKDLWKLFHSRFDASAAFLLDRLAKAGYELSGSIDSITAHASTQGTIRWANFTPLSIHRGNVAAWRKGRVALVGIDGVDCFDSQFAGQNLTALLSAYYGNDRTKFEPCTAILPWARRDGGLIPAEVARALDHPDRRESFVSAVESALEGTGCSHALIAPVLGLDSHSEALDLLEKRAGVRVSEPLIAAPHAIHGLRLQKALDRSLESAGVRTIQASVNAFEASGGRVSAVSGTEEAGPVRLEGRRFVLATGRFFSGGLVSKEGIWERIFGLRVFCGKRPVRERSVYAHLRPQYWSRQPAFEAGLRTGRDLRPVDAEGRVVYSNLFAAGTIIGGFDLAMDGTTQGVGLLTGFEAAGRASGEES